VTDSGSDVRPRGPPRQDAVVLERYSRCGFDDERITGCEPRQRGTVSPAGSRVNRSDV